MISRLVTPGYTVTRRFGMSISRTRLSLARLITTPPGTGSAPPDSPVPFAPSLEKAYIPQVDDVAEAIRDLAAY